MKNPEWGWSVDPKTGKQTLSVPKKGEYAFPELMRVQMAAVDFLRTVQGIILAQVTGKAPDGTTIPSRRKK